MFHLHFDVWFFVFPRFSMVFPIIFHGFPIIFHGFPIFQPTSPTPKTRFQVPRAPEHRPSQRLGHWGRRLEPQKWLAVPSVTGKSQNFGWWTGVPLWFRKPPYMIYFLNWYIFFLMCFLENQLTHAQLFPSSNLKSVLGVRISEYFWALDVLRVQLAWQRM